MLFYLCEVTSLVAQMVKKKSCLQWRRLEFDPLVGIRHNWATNTYLRLESKLRAYPMENNMEVSLKTKNRVTVWPSNFTPGRMSGKDKNSNLKRYMRLSVHSRTIYNSQETKATQVSSNRGMDKADVIYIYNSAIKKEKD